MPSEGQAAAHDTPNKWFQTRNGYLRNPNTKLWQRPRTHVPRRFPTLPDEISPLLRPSPHIHATAPVVVLIAPVAAIAVSTTVVVMAVVITITGATTTIPHD
jgi:hypothetical protein